jgi:hypothetical protein
MMQPDLHVEVEKLRAWLTTNRWVDHYDRWWSTDGVVGALQNFLAQVRSEDWTDDDVTALLYVLEQSSTDYIAEMVAERETDALAIAKHSIERGGIAGQDIAAQLRHCVGQRDEAEALLIVFAQDDFEYTRRIALLALAEMQSPAVQALAVTAWNTGDLHARIGALSALKTIGSALLPQFILLAQEDGREQLIAMAR